MRDIIAESFNFKKTELVAEDKYEYKKLLRWILIKIKFICKSDKIYS